MTAETKNKLDIDFLTLYGESCCMQELTMNLLMFGYDVESPEVKNYIFRRLVSLTLNEADVVYMKNDEITVKGALFLHEFSTEMECITEDCIKDMAVIVCRSVLSSRYKKYLIELFRCMCEKYPNIMYSTYQEQKMYTKYSV